MIKESTQKQLNRNTKCESVTRMDQQYKSNVTGKFKKKGYK